MEDSGKYANNQSGSTMSITSNHVSPCKSETSALLNDVREDGKSSYWGKACKELDNWRLYAFMPITLISLVSGVSYL